MCHIDYIGDKYSQRIFLFAFTLTQVSFSEKLEWALERVISKHVPSHDFRLLRCGAMQERGKMCDEWKRACDCKEGYTGDLCGEKGLLHAMKIVSQILILYSQLAL